jgi:hypothetical protein
MCHPNCCKRGAQLNTNLISITSLFRSRLTFSAAHKQLFHVIDGGRIVWVQRAAAKRVSCADDDYISKDSLTRACGTCFKTCTRAGVCAAECVTQNINSRCESIIIIWEAKDAWRRRARFFCFVFALSALRSHTHTRWSNYNSGEFSTRWNSRVLEPPNASCAKTVEKVKSAKEPVYLWANNIKICVKGITSRYNFLFADIFSKKGMGFVLLIIPLSKKQRIQGFFINSDKLSHNYAFTSENLINGANAICFSA